MGKALKRMALFGTIFLILLIDIQESGIVYDLF